jgi:hypothetical protein
MESDAQLKMMITSVASATHAPIYKPALALKGEELRKLYTEWRNGMTNKLDKNKAVFYPKFDDCEVGTTGQLNRPALKVPLTSFTLQEGQHQDKSFITRPVSKFHGTRTTILHNIFNLGIACSSESHGVTGLWANSELDWTLDWNSTALEPFPGTSIGLICEASHVCTNRRVRAANAQSTRCCILLKSHAPSVRLTDLYLLIPTASQISFREAVLNAIRSAVLDLLAGDRPDLQEEIVVQTTTLTEYRASYSGCNESFGPHFGGPFNSVSPIARHLSMQLARFVQGLSVESVKTRIKHFSFIHPVALPPRLVEWMNTLFPNISLLFSSEWPEVAPVWQATPYITVQKWGFLATSLPAGPQELEFLPA